ncbi:class I SAM-dependent methyltransferase [Mesorhizobium sp. ISC25]|uniref:hypothetical protein n=1 Tax=Mesorhizobium sp. ISC25 TaxID=3077335 RepID=UPI0035E279FA
MNPITKLIAGGPSRKSRLHSESGNLMPWKELRHLPRVAVEFTQSRLFGVRPAVPWWPVSVIPIIGEFLKAKPRDVIEFGSGSSTIWLAERAKAVNSIEDSKKWAETTNKRLKERSVFNATVRHAENSDYYDLGWISQQSFDLAIIDGSWRWRCVESVLPLMKPGSLIYLDNSDADKDRRHYSSTTMSKEAQKRLVRYSEAHPGSRIEVVHSLISGELHSGEGMLLWLNRD